MIVNKKKYLAIAKEAALTAGKFLADYKKANLKIVESRGKDIKISADKEAEKIIIDILKEKSDFPMLSEERGLIEGTKESGLRWIVDPLDGSLNFFRGVPISCVSIGLWDREKPALGVVYDFNRGELFEGMVGKEACPHTKREQGIEGAEVNEVDSRYGVGAWLNGKRISVSKIKNKKEAVITTGFPVRTSFSQKAIENYIKYVRAFKKVRLLGSAALSLAYVASARVDAYYEKDIMVWDIAAGLAVLSGAGGKYTMKKTNIKNAYIIKASNKGLCPRRRARRAKSEW